jgi:hypothetical protein
MGGHIYLLFIMYVNWCLFRQGIFSGRYLEYGEFALGACNIVNHNTICKDAFSLP